ncbi:MAG TPA: maleylpyruvate isomerase N-terminal domain-containing protein [Actinospica sp.]|nr:maleylpyruvate isomerase N-terminal domain-containing protein [Actinospica sp.]
MAEIFEDFLTAADAALGLLESAEVTGRWVEPSACAGFTVGGLAAHLAWQVQSAAWAVGCERPKPDAVVTGLPAHYEQAAWVGADADAPVNAGIRDSGEQRAQAGPGEVLRLAREARAALAAAFTGLLPQEVIAMPWIEGRAMTAGDVLSTRVLELLIHTDDLAVSVGVETPRATDSAYERLFALLMPLSVRRHGPIAVLRALSRAERAPESVSAF